MLLRPQQTRERGRPRPVLHARSTGEASGLGSRSRLGPCSPAPGRGWARAWLARPLRAWCGMFEQSCPSASQTGKLHPRVTEQLSSSAAE